MTSAPPRYADVVAAAADVGLLPRGGFHPDVTDAVPPLADGQPAATLLLLGNVGDSLWAHFAAADEYEDGRADPLDPCGIVGMDEDRDPQLLEERRGECGPRAERLGPQQHGVLGVSLDLREQVPGLGRAIDRGQALRFVAVDQRRYPRRSGPAAIEPEHPQVARRDPAQLLEPDHRHRPLGRHGDALGSQQAQQLEVGIPGGGQLEVVHQPLQCRRELHPRALVQLAGPGEIEHADRLPALLPVHGPRLRRW